MNKKISFYILGYKGYVVLADFLKVFSNERIECVIIGEDIKIKTDYKNEIIKLCDNQKINYFLRKDKYTINADLIFAIGWKWLIKENSQKLIIIHDSILPRNRGFNPLVTALLNKDKEIGVTALLAHQEYDKGDIVKQKIVKIAYPIKIAEAINKISLLYSEIVIEIVEDYFKANQLNTIKQDETKATYSLWRDERDYLIDWNNSAEYIKRFVDSVSFPYEGAQCFVDGQVAIVLESEIYLDKCIENRTPGKIIFIIAEYPVVVCGKGLLTIKKMISKKTGDNLLPLKKFRIRLN